MKFTQLPVGSRFLWQGERYAKTGPMTAHAADGSQKLIPRSARVEPAGAADGHHNAAGDAALARADVLTALAALTDSLREHAETLEGPQRSALGSRIDMAERDFRRALGLPD
jgi:hypothetical protein